MECNGGTTGRMWCEAEISLDINCLELKAALFALMSFCKETSNVDIKLLTDNSTTVACISFNDMDSPKPACNDIASDIWLWCLSTNNFVTAVHLPGCTNIEADFESRTDRHQIERHLNPIVFQGITLQLGICDMDLFASRVNAQLDKYVSWKPDPGAFAVDAFTLDWSGFRAVCFPLFSLILRVLQKVKGLEADCVLVVPI